MFTLKDNKVVLNGLAFSPDGALLAAGGYRGVVQVWDVAAGRLLSRPVGLQTSVDSVEFASADTLIAVGSSAYAWDVGGKSGRIEGRRWLPESFAIRLALSPDRRTAFVGHSGSTSGCRFDAFRFPEAERLWGHFPLEYQSVPVTFTFGPAGKVVYTGCYGGVVEAWDVPSGAARGVVARPGSYVKAIAVSPDGRRLACAAGGVLYLYGLDKPGEIAQHRLGRTHFLSVAFHPSGDFFASANGDGKVDYWDGRTGEHRQAFDWQVGKLHDVIFDPTGDRAACCSKTGQIVVWDVDR
jgi:WD40 repeat protein